MVCSVTQEKTGHRWEDNIKMNLKEAEGEGMDSVDLDENGGQCRAVVNMVINLRAL
jgi:hypothetical protein